MWPGSGVVGCYVKQKMDWTHAKTYVRTFNATLLTLNTTKELVSVAVEGERK